MTYYYRRIITEVLLLAYYCRCMCSASEPREHLRSSKFGVTAVTLSLANSVDPLTTDQSAGHIAHKKSKKSVNGVYGKGHSLMRG